MNREGLLGMLAGVHRNVADGDFVFNADIKASGIHYAYLLPIALLLYLGL
jgi:hypothetical protein